ncbi:MAG TPA: hypothetical protein VF807_03045 [Ktedonobacterales bacterium]
MQTPLFKLPANVRPSDARYRKSLAGIALIVIGALALVATLTQWTLMGESVVLALGLAFIVWGILAQSPGLMIPGGILSGIGSGVLLSQVVFSGLSGEAQGGVITLCMGLGFLLIMPLQRYFTKSDGFPWWPAIPGGVLAIIGLSLLGGAGDTFLVWLSRLWPIAVILVGLAILYGVVSRRSEPDQTPTAAPPLPQEPVSAATPPASTSADRAIHV